MKFDTDYLNKYKLVTWSQSKTLRTICKPVHTINYEIKQFAELLYMRMQEYDGVGIAAPQVWRTIRMAAFATIDIKDKEWNIINTEIMINPKIISTSKEVVLNTEWCLSLPGEEWEVARPKRATIEWLDVRWKKQLRKVEWYNARIMLHEIDHLDGILFIDKLTETSNIA